MKPEQKYENKCTKNDSCKDRTFDDYCRCSFSCPYQQSLSHLETEGELEVEVTKILCQDCFIHHKNHECDQTRPDECYGYLAKSIIAKLSPHLARLEGENQRLKGELRKQTLEIITRDSIIKNHSVEISQAVQAERDSIVKYLVKNHKCPHGKRKNECHPNACSDCWRMELTKDRQALQK